MNTKRVVIVLILVFLIVSAVFIAMYLNQPPNGMEDTDPPIIVIISPAADEVVSGTVIVNFTATDQSSIVSRQIVIDGVIRSNSQTYSWDTTEETNGLYNVTCRAQDIYSNLGVVTITVEVSNPIVHNNPPIVRITAPGVNAIVSDFVLIEVTVIDEEVLLPAIYIDDQYMITESTYLWNTSTFSNGVHTIHTNVSDSGGLSDSHSRLVSVYNGQVNLNYTGEFKVMTYNIEESGVNADWKEVVKEENPDIMILVETGTWDDSGSLLLNQAINEFNAYFTDEVPYAGYTAQGISYSTSGEAILSRFPVIDFTQIGFVPLDDLSSYDVTHDFIHAEVDINGTSVHVIGSHLKAIGGATNEEKRERETEGIINYMDNLGDVPIMYMGDLNSFSPADTGPLAPSGDLGYGPLTMMLYSNDPTYGQYSSEAHNFTDVFRVLNPTDPGYTYEGIPSRIDFIIVNDFFVDKLINSTCGDTAHANTGSDHNSVDVFVGWTTAGTTDSDPPAQVTGLNATAASAFQIDLEWNANNETDLYRYIVYRDSVEIAQVATTYYNDTSLSGNTTYSYEVSAEDNSGNEGNKSLSANATTLEAGAPDLVVINEILPDPYVLYTEEWIELFNPSALDVNLEGYILDDLIGGGTSPYTIPAGSIIPAGGFLVFNQSTTGVALNNAGDDVNLIKPDGTTVQDTYSYGSSINDVSHGRETDGSATWITFTSPTPGASNNGSTLFVMNNWVLVKDSI